MFAHDWFPISPYFLVFPSISRYFPLAWEILLFPGKLTTLQYTLSDRLTDLRSVADIALNPSLCKSKRE